MRHKNMLFDVMVMNMERQLVELAHERFGKPLEQCTDEEAFYVVMELTKRITEVCEKNIGEKKAYYISTEYLPGRLLGKNLMNLGLYQRMHDILRRFGKNLRMLEEQERELGYGQGSLGIATASLMDSAAMLGYPVEAFGIHYGPGGSIRNPGLQHSVLYSSRNDEEFWGNCIPMSFDVEIAGCRIRSRVHEMNVIGYVGGINKVRLFDLMDDITEIARSIDLTESDLRKLAGIAGTDMLLNLCRQYFLASNAAQKILREMKTRKYDLRRFDEHASITICSANAGLIIPELIRILVEEKAMNFMAAAGIVISTCAYTVCAAPGEKMQVWPVELLEKVIPKVMNILRLMQSIVHSSYEEEDLQIIDRNGNVHMERVCLHFTSYWSFVSGTQARILTGTRLACFARAYPERFAVRGSGISFRRWLMTANGELTKWIAGRIGEGFCGRTQDIAGLMDLERDEATLQSLLETKKYARRQLADYILAREGERILRGAVIDITTGAVESESGHRTMIAYIEHKIAQIQEGNMPARPVNFIFTGSAKDGDLAAAETYRRLRELQENVNRDPMLSPYLKVILLSGFNVTYAQYLISAADMANEMTRPENVSAGTTKMKCMVNGVVLLGLEGGGAEEVRALVGDDNIYMYQDEASLIRTKERMLEDYEDRCGWAQKMLVNIARSCSFSSDCTAQKYNDEIWKLPRV